MCLWARWWHSRILGYLKHNYNNMEKDKNNVKVVNLNARNLILNLEQNIWKDYEVRDYIATRGIKSHINRIRFISVYHLNNTMPCL